MSCWRCRDNLSSAANCPSSQADRDAPTVDGRLLEVLESHNMAQRVDQPTRQDGNVLDLLMDGDDSDIISDVNVVNPGLSDHSLVISDINIRRPKPELQQFSFRDIRTVDLADFTTRLQMADAYKNPADDVDSFYSQTESSVVAVLDALAPCKTRRKRRGKRSSRWLSDADVAAKRTVAQLREAVEAAASGR